MILSPPILSHVADDESSTGSRAVRHIIHVCRAESCQSMGSDELIQRIEDRLGIKLGDTTPDQTFTLFPIFCLGNCAHSPALMLDGRFYGRVSREIADTLIGDLQGSHGYSR
jgi:formate dehydrogenase subunit gamma